MKTLTLVLFVALAGLPNVFADEDAKKEKAVIKVADDGFPTGKATPEGVAADLARAFIKRDPKSFRESCIAPFGGGENRENYEAFLAAVTESIEAEAKKETPSPGGPKKITKVYAARRLSLNGPASAGYAMFNFHDIMFVDVVVETVAGGSSMVRTLVIMKEDKTWHAHPAPHTASLLSAGLNDEEDSTKNFSEAYTVEKPE